MGVWGLLICLAQGRSLGNTVMKLLTSHTRHGISSYLGDCYLLKNNSSAAGVTVMLARIYFCALTTPLVDCELR
jgi:hypothetical protein